MNQEDQKKPEPKNGDAEKAMWVEVKEAYGQGEDALRYAAQYFGLGIPEIYLHARANEWGPVGFAKADDPIIDPQKLPPMRELSPLDVISAHQDDLIRMRLMANLIDAKIHSDIVMGSKLDPIIRHLKNMTDIYSKIIPLERLAYGIDKDHDDGPEGGVTINNK